MKIINKVAFLVHEPTMFAHYSKVWAEMERDNFIIVLLSVFESEGVEGNKSVSDFMGKINFLGYDYIHLSDLLRGKVRYKYVVSNHFISGKSIEPVGLPYRLKSLIKQAINMVRGFIGLENRYAISGIPTSQYLPLQVGVKQVRFMYGADIGDGWSLQSWNDLYDLFLCHGPNDQTQLQKRFNGKTLVMGYPRYDDYFNQDLNISNEIEEFDLDPEKKTILWMSTLGNGASSIPDFAELIAELQQSYNVIARPHPIAFRQERENIELLKSMNFIIDDNAVRDMNKLYRLVDFVLCDFGGSAFGAIYLGKKLILLDVPVPTEGTCDWVIGASNFDLRDSVPIIGVDDFQDINELLADDTLWEQWENKTRALSDKYFADYRGTSSRKAAEIISNLDSILDGND